MSDADFFHSISFVNPTLTPISNITIPSLAPSISPNHAAAAASNPLSSSHQSFSLSSSNDTPPDGVTEAFIASQTTSVPASDASNTVRSSSSLSADLKEILVAQFENQVLDRTADADRQAELMKTLEKNFSTNKFPNLPKLRINKDWPKFWMIMGPSPSPSTLSAKVAGSPTSIVMTS